MSLKPDIVVLASGRSRDQGRRIERVPAQLKDLPDPPLKVVLAAARDAARPGRTLWLGGGEPTLRRDLPVLLTTLRAALPSTVPLGLRCDGLALAVPGVADSLRQVGLDRLWIPWHAARSDAHDWLVGRTGACQRVVRAVRAAQAVGLTLQLEVALTRPTLDLLSETASAAVALGVSTIILRPVTVAELRPDEVVAIAPRLALLQPALERIASTASRAGTILLLQGFPACVLGQARDLWGPQPQWVAPTLQLEPWVQVLGRSGARTQCEPCTFEDRAAEDPAAEDPAAEDPASVEHCEGVSDAYVAVFGRAELDDACRLPSAGAESPVRHDLAPLDTAPESGQEGDQATAPRLLPPPRAGRSPGTRVAFARRQAARPSLDADPLCGVPLRPVEPTQFVAFPAAASSRSLRQELCRRAQEGSATLRIDDAFSLGHPAAPALVKECVRLGFDRVELGGPVDALLDQSDRQLIGWRGLSRLTAWVSAEQDSTAVVEFLQRVGRLSGAEVDLRRLTGPTT